jgi:hypothetical protein
VRELGWSDFTFRLKTDRSLAIYAIIATAVWRPAGFAMALFLAGLRSVDPDLVKAAQIDGATSFVSTPLFVLIANSFRDLPEIMQNGIGLSTQLLVRRLGRSLVAEPHRHRGLTVH